MNFLCELTVVIAGLPCLICMANAASSMVVPDNSETSDSGNLCQFAMCAFASMCSHIELVSCSDGWQKTSRKTIHMAPGLPVSSIAQCKRKCHKGTGPELLQIIGCFIPTSIEAHEASNMICDIRSLKSQIKTDSFLEEIITSSNEVFKDWESDMVVGICKLCNSSWQTVKSYVIV